MGGDDDGIVLLVSTVMVMIYPVETAHSFDSVPQMADASKSSKGMQGREDGDQKTGQRQSKVDN